MLINFDFNFDPQKAAPKYRQFADALAEFLESSDLPAGSKLPNDRELARQYGIAKVTLSRALGLLEEKGVLERRVGAGTFVAAKSGKVGRRIALVCHGTISNDNGFVSSLWDELHRQAPAYQVDLLILQRFPKDYQRAVNSYNLDGLIVLSAEMEFLPELQELARRGVAIAQVGMFHSECREISFGTDHMQAAGRAVEYLYDLGHRKIGFIMLTINGKPHFSSVERLHGYQKAMYDKFLPVNPDWIIGSGINMKCLGEDIYKLHDQNELPTAFILDSLGMAPKIYHIMRTINCNIPQDISFIGFDNAPLCSQLTPGLSCCGHDTKELVTKVFNHLCGREKHDGMPLPLILTERESCAKVNINFPPKNISTPKTKENK
ncbi:MAG: LacI family transcriptional regulator [Lentisphaerae bacterium]|nr:LacI family transcriptional regulator [Lentisphaerota bacterium]